MNFERDDNYTDFFDKLHSNGHPRNLRQIFEDDDKPLEHESNNLRYVAHKQKEKEEDRNATTQKQQLQQQQLDAAKSTLIWKTILAKVAFGYNGFNEIGRVGVAISRNNLGGVKLFVYRSRNQLLGTLMLTKSPTSSSSRGVDAKLMIRQSYLQFYDDDNTYWSLRFEKSEDEEIFLHELRKFNLAVDKKCDESPVTIKNGMPTPIGEIGDSDNDSIRSISATDSTTSSRGENKALVPLVNPKGSTAINVDKAAVSKISKGAGSILDSYREEHRRVDDHFATLLRKVHETSSTAVGTCSSEKTMKIIYPNKLKDCVHSTTNDEDSDKEDEMIELEQKLLDIKKKNRTLTKSLKKKDHALNDLRTSTNAMCEDLMNQNTELKLKNTVLLTSLSIQANGLKSNDMPASSNGCKNCDLYLAKITEMEQRMASMYDVLISFATATTTASTADHV